MILFHPGRHVRIGSLRPGWMLVRFHCPRCFTPFYLETRNDPPTKSYASYPATCPVCSARTEFPDGTGDYPE